MSLTAIILTKGEKNFTKVVESVGFCDEIVVIVDNLAKNQYPIPISNGQYQKKLKIIRRILNGDFATQRNFAMGEAKGEWILFVDADEVVSKELAEEIKHGTWNMKHGTNAYYIKRRDYFWGHELKYGETKKIRQMGLIRLMRKGSGKWEGAVHEVFHTTASVGRLHGFLDHYPHQTLKEFIADINYYSTLRAKELFNNNVSVNILQIIFYPLGKFVLSYFLYLGFLDGPAGFVYSFMMSFHSFLVRAKLYQYRKIDVAK